MIIHYVSLKQERAFMQLIKYLFVLLYIFDFYVIKSSESYYVEECDLQDPVNFERVVAFSRSPGMNLYEAVSIEQTRKILSLREFAWLCSIQGRVCAMVTGTLKGTNKEILHLTDLGTLPDSRRQGIATALALRLKDIADQKQCNKATLQVDEKNNIAKEFYDKLGFVVTGTSVIFSMEKNLK